MTKQKHHFSINPLPQFSQPNLPIFQHSIIPGNCERSELNAYISGSRAHDNIYMVHGIGYLKGFKAAKSQTPNLPSPPFPFLWSPRPGSSYSLTPLKAQKPPGHKGTPHKKSVTSIVSLCPGGAF
jgi:hypothetical protein